MSKYIRVQDLGSTRARPGRLPIHPNSIWRLVREGKFPSPIKLSEAVTAWRISDIEEWEKSREEASQ